MDTPHDFATNNQAYLKAGLSWLRARIKASLSAAAIEHTEPAIEQASGTPVASARLLITDADRAYQAFEQARRADPPPALEVLAGRLGLSGFEQNMLLLATAPELDTDMPALMAAAHDDTTKRAPTFALGMQLFDEAAWDALSPERPLRAAQLLEVHQSGITPLIAAPLRIDERIAAYIKGLNYLDERIDALTTVVPAPAGLPASQERAARTLAHWLSTETANRVVQLIGSDDASKRDVLAAAAVRTGRRVLSLMANDLPTQPEEVDRFVRLWMREAHLMQLALLIEGVDADIHELREDAVRSPGMRSTQWLQRLRGTVFISTRQVLPEWDGSAVLPIEPPDSAEREALWRTTLEAHGFPRARHGKLDRLASEFILSASRIGSLVADMQPDDGNTEIGEQAWNACVAHAASTLDGLAQRITVHATIDDVKLPEYDKVQLERLIAHARQRAAVLSTYGFQQRSSRGLGLAALFHGESGTGKTMAAEAVAQALKLALFRIDLSAVVSKYIGETSKNLRRVFDAAEGGGTVLLFDEADSVFGKRSEVKDSHDRYANIDINYLLTRMESFGGVTILATNMKHALDPAFVRRLRFIVGFPFPGAAERRAIWENILPRGERVDVLDYDRLARFALTGGSIFNAALAAAHGAASEGKPIAMPHVLDAIRWELRKIERPVAESEFRWVPPPESSAPGSAEEAA